MKKQPNIYDNNKPNNSEIITLKFLENYNNKLYGKYFTTIRNVDKEIKEGNIYEIELNGKCVKSAKCISMQVVKFHELNELTITMDTGLKYGDAMLLFNKFGIKVADFETDVKYCLFETLHTY